MLGWGIVNGGVLLRWGIRGWGIVNGGVLLRWDIIGWGIVGGTVADTNYLYPARWGWINKKCLLQCAKLHLFVGMIV